MYTLGIDQLKGLKSPHGRINGCLNLYCRNFLPRCLWCHGFCFGFMGNYHTPLFCNISHKSTQNHVLTMTGIISDCWIKTEGSLCSRPTLLNGSLSSRPLLQLMLVNSSIFCNIFRNPVHSLAASLIEEWLRVCRKASLESLIVRGTFPLLHKAWQIYTSQNMHLAIPMYLSSYLKSKPPQSARGRTKQALAQSLKERAPLAVQPFTCMLAKVVKHPKRHAEKKTWKVDKKLFNHESLIREIDKHAWMRNTFEKSLKSAQLHWNILTYYGSSSTDWNINNRKDSNVVIKGIVGWHQGSSTDHLGRSFGKKKRLD